MGSTGRSVSEDKRSGCWAQRVHSRTWVRPLRAVKKVTHHDLAFCPYLINPVVCEPITWPCPRVNRLIGDLFDQFHLCRGKHDGGYAAEAIFFSTKPRLGSEATHADTGLTIKTGYNLSCDCDADACATPGI